MALRVLWKNTHAAAEITKNYIGIASSFFQQQRTKYTQNKGVKGIRNRKSFYDAIKTENVNGKDLAEVHTTEHELLCLDDRAYDEVAHGAMRVTRDVSFKPQHVLIIQPYVKWGPQRSAAVEPEHKLNEAVALVHSLPNWHVAHKLKVPLESLERKTLFGSGKIVELKAIVQELRQRGNQQPLTCLFVSKGTLSFAQKRFLEAEFKLPVMDRYTIVIQILRLHATSAEARLQVAMAELPYIWAQAKDANTTQSRKLGYTLTDLQREILRTRERKLKLELEKIRNQRKLLRKKRKQQQYPIIAVVGYTNAGKTSLIKALTSEHTMQPRDQLFATLDVTAHAGMLPCNLQVIYMDTVGFMSDLPTGLIECFVATLEDAMLADIILHVQDLSHACHMVQRQHVENTLQMLANNIAADDAEQENAGNSDKLLPPIINVCNKIDLIANPTQHAPNDVNHLVSAQQQIGLQQLLEDIETQILRVTGRRSLKMRIRNGGQEMSWLYKNAAVVNMQADPENPEMLIMKVIISQSVLEQFKRIFCQ